MLPITAGFDFDALLDIARAADRAGVEAVGIGEFAGTEAMALAGAVATVTTRIRIETGVVSVLTRSPALLAMGAATVQHLAKGRFVLGLGAGSPIGASYHQRSFERPLATIDAAVDDIRTVLGGGTLDAAGRFRLTPVVPVEVPIYVSAINEKMLDFAARSADGVYLSMLTGVEGIRQAVARLTEARNALRRTNSFRVVVIQHAYTGEDADVGELAFRTEIAPYFAVSTYGPAVRALGTEAEVEAVAEVWRSGGRAAAAGAVPEAAVEALYVAGGTAEFAERMALLTDAGADAVRFLPVRTGVLDEVMGLVDVLGALGAQPIDQHTRDQVEAR